MRIGKYILTIAFLALSAGGFAQKFNYNGMRFRLLTDSTVAVGNHHIPYDTLSYDTRPSEIPPQVGDIVIPTKVEYQGRHYAVTEIGDSAFMQCYDITSVEIPEGITKIGSWAFRLTYNIKEFIIPQSVRYIGDYAFYRHHCESIILPDTIEFIGEAAFSGYGLKGYSGYYIYDLYDIENIVIPYGIKTIKKNCFHDCWTRKLEIPETVETIEECGISLAEIIIFLNPMFPNKEQRERYDFEIVCHATIPPQMKGYGWSFDTTLDTTKFPKEWILYVPEKSVEEYRNANMWNYFQTILPIGSTSGITSVNEEPYEVGRWTIDGKSTDHPSKGLNIVKMSDGTTRKVFVK